jgi:WD40 repeat protein/serine/threonine protein kinase
MPARIGAYPVLGLLGRGGMGVVYLARDDKLGRRVALKAMTSPLLQNVKARERFQREVRAVARLSHPSIVPIYDVGEADGVPFFTMECIDGRTLAEVLSALRKTLHPPAELSGSHLRQAITAAAAEPSASDVWRRSYVETVCRLMLEVLEGLAHAHVHGVVHRDVKPSNVLVTAKGRAHLFDFGLARLDADLSLTQTGEFVGTPYYAAPEQVDGQRTPGDTRSDVYSAGVTLYELLTLRVPFQGDTPHEVFKQVTQKEPPPPRRLNAAIPRDLETVVLTALEKDPARRYPGALEFAEDLRRFLEFRPVIAQPAGMVTRALRLIRRNRSASAAVFLLAVLLAGAPIAYGLLERSHRHDVENALGVARQEKLQKDAALVRSEGLRLLAQSSLTLDDNPGLALLLALEGHARSPGLLANTALIESLDALREVRTLVGHTDKVLGVAVSPDGTRFLTTSADRTARVWDLATGRVIQTLAGHEGAVFDGCFHPLHGRTLLTACEDGALRVWDTAAGANLGVLRGPQAGVQSVACSSDGTRAVAAGGRCAWISSVAAATAPVVLIGHRGPVRQAVFSPDGTTVATASEDRTVRVWDAATGVALETLQGHEGPALGVAFSPDGRLLASAGADRTVRLWARESAGRWRRAQVLRAHEGWVTSVAFHPTAPMLVSGAMDRTVRVWSLAEEGRLLATLRGHTNGVTAVAVTPDGRLCLSGGMDGVARLWQLPEPPPPRDGMPVPGVAVGEKSALPMPKATPPDGAAVAMSPDGRRLLTNEGDEGIQLRESGTLRELGRIKKPSGRHVSARFSRRGNEVVLVTQEGFTFWDADKGAELRTLDRRGARPRTAALSPDGQLLVAACEDGVARILDARSGALVREVGGKGPSLWDAEFSADGELVVTASEDHTARVYRARDGQLLAVLRGHQAEVRSVAFSADGQRVVTTGRDATVRVFVWAEAREVAVLPGHETDVARASFDADGTRVRILMSSGKERVMPIDPAGLARARMPRELTPAERARFELPAASVRG